MSEKRTWDNVHEVPDGVPFLDDSAYVRRWVTRDGRRVAEILVPDMKAVPYRWEVDEEIESGEYEIEDTIGDYVVEWTPDDRVIVE